MNTPNRCTSHSGEFKSDCYWWNFWLHTKSCYSSLHTWQSSPPWAGPDRDPHDIQQVGLIHNFLSPKTSLVSSNEAVASRNCCRRRSQALLSLGEMLPGWYSNQTRSPPGFQKTFILLQNTLKTTVFKLLSSRLRNNRDRKDGEYS